MQTITKENKTNFTKNSTKNFGKNFETKVHGQVHWQDWGLIDYNSALSRQQEVLKLVQDKESLETIIFCTHPPVVTLGRSAQDYEFENWQGELIHTTRGGRSTYHGPSQLVVYPILDLRKESQSGYRKKNDVITFLRLFEKSLVETVSEYGVKAKGQTAQKRDKNTTAEMSTGVWVGDRKLASLGIGVKRWCTFHGAAINLHKDKAAFVGVHPCGFKPEVMVSLEELTGEVIDHQDFIDKLKRKLLEFLL